MWLTTVSVYSINANSKCQNFKHLWHKYRSKRRIKLLVSSLQRQQNSACAWLWSLRVPLPPFFFPGKRKKTKQNKDHCENIRSLIWKTNLTANAAMTAVTVTRGITSWDFNVLCWRQPGGVQKGFDKTESGRKRVRLVAVTQKNPCCNCCTASC